MISFHRGLSGGILKDTCPCKFIHVLDNGTKYADIQLVGIQNHRIQNWDIQEEFQNTEKVDNK